VIVQNVSYFTLTDTALQSIGLGLSPWRYSLLYIIVLAEDDDDDSGLQLMLYSFV